MCCLQYLIKFRRISRAEYCRIEKLPLCQTTIQMIVNVRVCFPLLKQISEFSILFRVNASPNFLTKQKILHKYIKYLWVSSELRLK